MRIRQRQQRNNVMNDGRMTCHCCELDDREDLSRCQYSDSRQFKTAHTYSRDHDRTVNMSSGCHRHSFHRITTVAFVLLMTMAVMNSCLQTCHAWELPSSQQQRRHSMVWGTRKASLEVVAGGSARQPELRIGMQPSTPKSSTVLHMAASRRGRGGNEDPIGGYGFVGGGNSTINASSLSPKATPSKRRGRQQSSSSSSTTKNQQRSRTGSTTRRTAALSRSAKTVDDDDGSSSAPASVATPVSSTRRRKGTAATRGVTNSVNKKNSNQIKGMEEQQQQQQQQPQEHQILSRQQQMQQRKHKLKQGSYFLEKRLLNHDLLTKEQEHELGFLVQRAQQLQTAINAAVESKKLRQQQQLLKEQQKHQRLDEDDNDWTALNADDRALFSSLRRRRRGLSYDRGNSVVGEDDVDDVDEENKFDEDEDEMHQLSIYGMISDEDTERQDAHDLRDFWTKQVDRLRQREYQNSLLHAAKTNALYVSPRQETSSMTKSTRLSSPENGDEDEYEDDDYDFFFETMPDDDSYGDDNRATLDSELDQKLQFLSEDEIKNVLDSVVGEGAWMQPDAATSSAENNCCDAVRAILFSGSIARETLIQANFRLVKSVAQKWAKQSAGHTSWDGTKGIKSMRMAREVYDGGWDRPSLDEALQEGILGLADAVDRFDPSRGLRFATYATWYVTNSVRTCYQRASTGVLRLPPQMYLQKQQYRTLVKQYYESDGSVPGMDVLAEDLGISLARLQLVLRVSQKLMSLDQPLMRFSYIAAGKSGSGGFQDTLTVGEALVDRDNISPEDRLELSFLRQNLENAMATELAPHERDIIRLRLGLDDGVQRTAVQVAKEIGGSMSPHQIRRHEKRAYNKLRSPQALSTYKFLTYLDVAGLDMSTVTLT